MRLGVVIAALAVVGCGPPTDPTPNRVPAAASGYPAGPYGYAQGSVMANLTFIGKDSPAPADYSTLPMQPLALADLRAGGTKLILIEGAARWCTYCQEDQPAVQQIESDYGPRGVRVLEILSEGGYGITATEDDINRWAAAHQLWGPVVLDPERQLAKYADVSSYPLYMVVRASTMTIAYMKTGGMSQYPVPPVLDVLLAE